MKKTTLILTVMILIIPLFVKADEWIKIDLFFGVCDLDDETPAVDCVVDIEPFIETGDQFQLAVESVAAHNRSGLSAPSDPILVVGPATPPGIREALRGRAHPAGSAKGSSYPVRRLKPHAKRGASARRTATDRRLPYRRGLPDRIR